MNFDEELQRAIDSLTERLRSEVARHLEATSQDLQAVVETDRIAASAQAACDAREAAEHEAGDRLTAAVAYAEERSHAAGHVEGWSSGREEGWEAGFAAGFNEGREEGRAEGLEAGRAEGLEAGRAEGLEAGRAEGLESGRAEGLEAGRAEGWEGGRADGWTTGREQGFEAGRTEGWEAGRTEGWEGGRAEGWEAGRTDGWNAGRAEGWDAGQTGLTEAQARADSDREAGYEAARHAGGQEESDRLAEGVRAIDSARSLSEILDALTASASHEAARIAVFTVHGGQLRGWRFAGFGPDPEQLFNLSLSNTGIIAEAVRRGHSVKADGAAAIGNAAGLPRAPAHQALAVPVAIGGHVVAVLYCDQGEETATLTESTSSTLSAGSVEILARHAARCLETVTTFRSAQVLARRSGQLAFSAESPEPKRDLDHGLERTDEGGEHAAVDPESFYLEATKEMEGAEAAEEARAARRYARLLVSEIKLYHEEEVVAGCRGRDLATRLGGEIARARGQYEERVPLHVRHVSDYFQAELVSTLANGDASLLGQALRT